MTALAPSTAGAKMPCATTCFGFFAGLAAAGGLTAVITAWTRSVYRKKWSEVLSEVEGVLDVLQMDEPLQPPPPSWRKWVERQFHGARRLLDMDNDGDVDEPHQ